MKTICKRRSITEFTEPLKHEIKKSDLTGDSIRAVFFFVPVTNDSEVKALSLFMKTGALSRVARQGKTGCLAFYAKLS